MKLRKASDTGSVKCVLVGDANVGKSCLAAKFATGKYTSQYFPTTFDNYAVTQKGNKASYVLSIFDTAGRESYDQLRILSYVDCDVVLVCFSVISGESVKSVEANWINELQQYLPDTPLVIIGTKIDKREDIIKGGGSVTTMTKGKQLAERLGAYGYAECSALCEDGLVSVFDLALEAALSGIRSHKEDSSCSCACTII